jgi:hypothetical protein
VQAGHLYVYNVKNVRKRLELGDTSVKTKRVTQMKKKFNKYRRYQRISDEFWSRANYLEQETEQMHGSETRSNYDLTMKLVIKVGRLRVMSIMYENLAAKCNPLPF